MECVWHDPLVQRWLRKYLKGTWEGHLNLGVQQGIERIDGPLGLYVLELSEHTVMFFDLLPWAIHQEEDGFQLSLLSTSPAHTRTLLLVEVRLNMLYLLAGAPRGYAVRLLLKLCRRVPVSVHWKLFFRLVYWTAWSHEFGNTVFHPMHFAWYIIF